MLGNGEHLVELVDVGNNLGFGSIIPHYPVEMVSGGSANALQSYPDHNTRVITRRKRLILTLFRENVIIDGDAYMFNSRRILPRLAQYAIGAAT